MARYSANGKLIGRPPKNPQPEQTPVAQAARTFTARYDAAGQGRERSIFTIASVQA